ncbi:YeeE/YedE family protein [Salinisphaera sp. SPP-AMP-43]|uniref:YeeE/YedE family protein n=1 Tax=Salinisphaera sp. SPP-AMP-43 TaxID=3121288 RepID=UPI003C6E7ABE
MSDIRNPERPARTLERPPAPRPGPTAIAGLAAVTLLVILFVFQGLQLGLLFIVALGFGVALYHARFGFTSAFRQLMAVGQGETLRAHMLMLATASLLFAPLLALGTTAFGGPLAGYVSPVGLSVAFGGFIFCIGMQLGGACASGSLYTVGSGQTSILITLAGFIVGSVWGAHDFGFWLQPDFVWTTVSLADTRWGYTGAVVFQFIIIAAIVAATFVVEKRLNPPPRVGPPSEHGLVRVLRGTWPLWAGALVLAVLNAITLWLSGKPWGITSAFALWGSQALSALGVDVGSWYYWSGPHAGGLDTPILADRTSIMDIGIIFGAMAASAWGGTFKIATDLPWRIIVARLLGGILMGYGARIAFGCNIGAYFGGIASFSLHGWLWGAVGLAGTLVGIKLRPLFGMGVPKLSDSSC